MSIADELHALHDRLFREERLLRSEEDVLARAVEALRRMEKCRAWLRDRRDKLADVDPVDIAPFDEGMDFACHRALALLDERPSAAERSEDGQG